MSKQKGAHYPNGLNEIERIGLQKDITDVDLREPLLSRSDDMDYCEKILKRLLHKFGVADIPSVPKICREEFLICLESELQKNSV